MAWELEVGAGRQSRELGITQPGSYLAAWRVNSLAANSLYLVKGTPRVFTPAALRHEGVTLGAGRVARSPGHHAGMHQCTTRATRGSFRRVYGRAADCWWCAPTE